jgi:hypothetical protein
MAATTTRIARKLAATTAAIVTAGVISGAGLTAAHAADHFEVDRDAISLDENNALVNATMESFHDGNHLLATLSGTVGAAQDGWCGKISVKFVYHDGSEDLHWRNFTQAYPCGTPTSAITSVSSDPTKSVVSYRYQTSSLPPTGAVQFGPVHEDIVGDAPDSTGTCNQLDRDSVTINGSGVPSFSGDAYYRCLTSTGNIRAQVSGTVDNTRIFYYGGVRVVFVYSDGTTSTQTSAMVSPGGTARFSMYSDSAKNVRQAIVQTFTMGGSTGGPQFTSYFGDFVHTK